MQNKYKKNGLFITFEGVEGAGKTTQVNMLFDFIKLAGRNCIKVREPGSTTLGEKLRLLVSRTPKNLKKDICQKAELLMFQASRAQLMYEIILPSLKSNDIVISDRFFDSSIAYQGASDSSSNNMKMIKNLNNFVSFNKTPDITFILDLDPKIGLTRVDTRNTSLLNNKINDKFENKSIEFHNKVRKIFLSLRKLKSDRKIRILSGLNSANEIHNKIIQILNEEFKIF